MWRLQDIKNKKAYIVDVDGTLYSQIKMRIYMSVKLICYYALHVYRYKELICLYRFRQMRESAAYNKASIEQLCRILSARVEMSAEEIRGIIDQWLFKVPLKIINKCRYDGIIDFLNDAYFEGRKVFIYSDYPAEDKLKVLRMDYDCLYYPEKVKIYELKPSKTMMGHIAESIGMPVDEILFIGNRDEKDKRSAELIGIDYCDVKEILMALWEDKAEI